MRSEDGKTHYMGDGCPQGHLTDAELESVFRQEVERRAGEPRSVILKEANAYQLHAYDCPLLKKPTEYEENECVCGVRLAKLLRLILEGRP